MCGCFAPLSPGSQPGRRRRESCPRVVTLKGPLLCIAVRSTLHKMYLTGREVRTCYALICPYWRDVACRSSGKPVDGAGARYNNSWHNGPTRKISVSPPRSTRSLRPTPATTRREGGREETSVIVAACLQARPRVLPPTCDWENRRLLEARWNPCPPPSILE